WVFGRIDLLFVWIRWHSGVEKVTHAGHY
ncbi:MAG: hypothetical protein JWP80_831, partial [Pseudomonas sp.]|nr:hypothetical protein [Pseudomonas sp.]